MRGIGLPVIAGLAVGISLVIILSVYVDERGSLGEHRSARISQDDAISIVEANLKDWNNHEGVVYGINYTIADIAIDVPKTLGGHTTYISISEFEKQEVKLPLVYLSDNGTLILVENGRDTIIRQCINGLDYYCGYLWPFEIDYRESMFYSVQILALAKDKEQLFFWVDANSGEIVDSTFVRMHTETKMSDQG
ncbi:MAG TPA: hypothetical protein VJP79_11260 [Nitrososphaera sp.]|nr:hypothetical protein [Nitrososphaera sp.]